MHISTVLLMVKTSYLVIIFHTFHLFVPLNSVSVPTRQFYLKKDPTVGPIRLSSGWKDSSLLSCAVNCKAKYATCTSFMFDSSTQHCTPGSSVNDTAQPLPTVAEGELYVMYECDASESFQLLRYKNEIACIAIIGHLRRSFDDAYTYCVNRRSYLVSVKTREKLELLANASSPTVLWVGWDDQEIEGKWINSGDGSVMTAAQKSVLFRAGQATVPTPAENCALFFRNQMSFQDYPCHQKYRFACEMPLP